MKPFEGFTAETIDFLWELRMNNSREWMEENRDRYKRVLKEPFDSLAAALVAESIAFGGREMKCSVSRINRDIRFSKDKSPYRASRWVVLYDAALQGTAWKERPSFYFELNPEGYEPGLGMWCSPSAFLAAYRRKIESNPAAFERMAKKFEKPLFSVWKGEHIKNSKMKRFPRFCRRGIPKRMFCLWHAAVWRISSFPLNYHSSSQRDGAGSKISMLFWMPLKRNKKGVDLG